MEPVSDRIFYESTPEPQWLDANIVEFAVAEIGDHAYTWEAKDGHGFGEYRFETAGDPRSFYEDSSPIMRKRWELVEVVELP